MPDLLKKKKKRKKKKQPLTPLEKSQKKLNKTILEMFRLMGFEYIRTGGKHQTFGGQQGEIDNVFIFENIILLCEETLVTNPGDHLRKKYDFYEKIIANKNDFLNWVKVVGKDKFDKFNNYSASRYKIFYIYIT